jgi:nitrite reductase/ring-hydroxylating ferredoxin subunit
MSLEQSRKNSGSAYDLKPPTYDADLTLVTKGSRGGELLRRYWHPIALVSDVKDIPLAVRALGEDLILFRTPNGRLGLVHPRCAHRGSSLLYGKVEERGIRCCYHGWLFDTDGTCVEQPCEPEGGLQRDACRQPWYPVEERYGLIFAYMGPLAAKPALPRYDVLENIGEGFKLHADGDSIGSGGPERMPCNWFQTHENIMDSWHVFVLHATFSTSQFTDLMAIRPNIHWETTEHGMVANQVRNLDDGNTLHRVVELVMPNVRIVPDPRLKISGKTTNVAWTLPIDDTNTRIFSVIRLPKEAPIPRFMNRNAMYDGKTWFELDAEGHQRLPGDFEAQVSQGEITFHSEEHLATSDRGVSMYRRMYRQAVRDVHDGKDPINVVREGDALVRVRAGNYIGPTKAAVNQ